LLGSGKIRFVDLVVTSEWARQESRVTQGFWLVTLGRW
jgi:hypothetical protein